MNKSKDSKILFEDSSSSFLKKYKPIIALTPPPSKANTFLYFLEKRLRYFKFFKKIMLKPYFISFSVLCSLYISSDDGIFGYWLTSGSIVKIENCNNLVCGKIETIFVDDGTDPKSILDENNKNKSLRDRTLIGINLLSDFVINDENQKTFKGGKIYDPRSGNTYKSNLYLSQDGILKVEGCLAFICDGEEWQPLMIKINEDGSREAVPKNSPQSN
tara:strand:- start:387 stop:1034 length:648 start_codon:yes stop_codon:yes gene_type:complete